MPKEAMCVLAVALSVASASLYCEAADKESKAADKRAVVEASWPKIIPPPPADGDTTVGVVIKVTRTKQGVSFSLSQVRCEKRHQPPIQPREQLDPILESLKPGAGDGTYGVKIYTGNQELIGAGSVRDSWATFWDGVDCSGQLIGGSELRPKEIIELDLPSDSKNPIRCIGIVSGKSETRLYLSAKDVAPKEEGQPSIEKKNDGKAEDPFG